MQTKTIFLLIATFSLAVVIYSIFKTQNRSLIIESFEFPRGPTLTIQGPSSPQTRQGLLEIVPDATRFNYSTPLPNAKHTQPQGPPMTSNHTMKIGAQLQNQATTTVNDPSPTKPNQPYVSISQQLAGKQNPKTLVNPIVVQPIANLDYWKASPLVVNSHTNNQTNFDTFNSGYQVTTCCNNPDPQNPQFQQLNRYVGLQSAPQYLPPYTSNQFVQPPPENFTYLAESETARPLPFDGRDRYHVYPQNPIDTSYGYHHNYPIDFGVPVNSAITPSAENKFHNQQVYTQTLQPGVYTTTQVNEPVNANIGISFTQGFEPTTVAPAGPHTGYPGVMYTAHDPTNYQRVEEKRNETFNSPTTVFDPRLTGYGSSNRSYTDSVTGQTRYYYDDINAVRMPNYITRNNLDVFGFMDTYGVMSNGTGNVDTAQIRTLAQQNWFDQSNAQRADLQSSLMRKNMFITAQRRIAPFRGN